MADKVTPEQKKKLKELGEFKEYKKSATVLAKKMDKPFVCNTLEGDNIRGKAGDYLCIGIEGETYPCDAKIFESTYEEV